MAIYITSLIIKLCIHTKDTSYTDIVVRVPLEDVSCYIILSFWGKLVFCTYKRKRILEIRKTTHHMHLILIYLPRYY